MEHGLASQHQEGTNAEANMAPATSSSDDAAEHATAASSHEPQLPPCVAYPETPVCTCVYCTKALGRPTRAIPFLCPGQLEMARLLVSTLLRFLHRDGDSSGAAQHGVQAYCAAVHWPSRRARERHRGQHDLVGAAGTGEDHADTAALRRGCVEVQFSVLWSKQS